MTSVTLSSFCSSVFGDCLEDTSKADENLDSSRSKKLGEVVQYDGPCTRELGGDRERKSNHEEQLAGKVRSRKKEENRAKHNTVSNIKGWKDMNPGVAPIEENQNKIKQTKK